MVEPRLKGRKKAKKTMVGGSKILTVSYGTFSCTLEGFDDPIAAMRSITEYFRDLAAHDRYFGAEPPTPDAETLHRIAARQNGRPVEARLSDTGVVLRQMPEDDPDEAEPVETAGAALSDRALAGAVSVPSEPAGAAPEVAESVAAKLARIRAAVARSAQPEPLMNNAFSEDEHAEPLYDETPIATAFTAEAEADDAAPEETAEIEPEIEPVAADTEPPEIDELEPAEDTQDAWAQADDVFEPDLEAQPQPDPEPEVEAQPEPGLETETYAEPDLEAQPQPDLDGDLDGDLDAGVQAEGDETEAAVDPDMLAAEAAPYPDAADTPTETPASDPEIDLSILGDTLERDDDMGTADAEEPLDLSGMEADADDAEAATEPETQTDTAPEAPRARVLKMTREEFEARYEALDDAEDAEDEDDEPEDVWDDVPDDDAASAVADAAEDDSAADDSDLSPEAEADLQKELAAATLADAIDEDAETPQDAADPSDPEAIKRDLRAALEVQGEVDERPVDRLLAQTNSELESGEGSRRRSAIAHLKAAVQAVRADGGRERMSDDGRSRDMNEYRDDLARAVRPAPSETARAAESEAETPADPPAETVAETAPPAQGASVAAARAKRRLPPLMLVSEQRIDRPAAQPKAGGVSPRRVHAAADDDPAETAPETPAAEDDFDDSRDFKSFVADIGAEGLQDYLEASAAYASVVEGQPLNTRPQIMHRVVKLLPEGSFTREEGLRAFGVLLREGRIVRVERGQFSIAPTSQFAPDKVKTATG